ncbi:MAG: hypothetical protein AAF965_09805 [Pseudomonadota bacterium]
MRLLFGATAMLSLAACATQIPDSAAGIPNAGPGTSQTYAQQVAAREAALQSSPVPPAGAISDEVTSTAPLTTGAQTLAPLNATGTQIANAPAGAFATVGDGAPATTSDALARDAVAALADTAPARSEPVLTPSPSSPSPQTVSTAGGISNENNFDAVGNARSIDADAQLIAQNRSQYQVVQPTALPNRSSSSEPNVVQYALSTTHAVGTTVYSRSGINKQSRAQRACAKYGSPDLAQADFLSKGGPRKDRLGLDPDGDGFACDWDPRPFRAAVGG